MKTYVHEREIVAERIFGISKHFYFHNFTTSGTRIPGMLELEDFWDPASLSPGHGAHAQGMTSPRKYDRMQGV